MNRSFRSRTKVKSRKKIWFRHTYRTSCKIFTSLPDWSSNLILRAIYLKFFPESLRLSRFKNTERGNLFNNREKMIHLEYVRTQILEKNDFKEREIFEDLFRHFRRARCVRWWGSSGSRNACSQCSKSYALRKGGKYHSQEQKFWHFLSHQTSVKLVLNNLNASRLKILVYVRKVKSWNYFF